MEFSKTFQVDGDGIRYSINSELKRYTLLDLGFVMNKNSGSYTMEKSLDPTTPYNKSIKIKIVINNNLDMIKVHNINSSGLKKVNIFQMQDSEPVIEQYKFIIQNLVDRKVIEKIN